VKFHVQLAVWLKEGLLDPQGKAVEGALPSLGWDNVSNVRVGKDIELDVEAADESAATAQVDEMARRFLTNPVIEDCRILSVTSAVASTAAEGAP
jgi:phosphoribosylformylglycinamidine synthase subunit PurS